MDNTLFTCPIYFSFDRKQAFEAALLAQTWKVKYEDIKWPKNKGKLGSRKSMVSLFYSFLHQHDERPHKKVRL